MEPPRPEPPTPEALAAENATLKRQLAALSARLREALAEIERLQRQGKRQAAPFSTGTRNAHPKKPGRKPGQGPFTGRAAPTPEQLSAPPLEVPVTTASCPGCGGALQPAGTETVTVTDLPPVVQPQVTAYQVEICRCARCGQRVRGRHPAIAPDQHGATAHRLGPRALAAAHGLHYGIGVPQRKVPAVLAQLTGLTVTQGALAQDAQRRAAGQVGQAYQQLRREITAAPAIHTDDTGWKIGGENAQLMTFTTPTTTVYQIRKRHRNEEVREVVPATYGGTLITDRGPSYDAQALQGVKQQKCLGHILRNLAAARDQQPAAAQAFPRKLQRLLRQALRLWHQQQEGAPPDFARRREGLQRALTWVLRDRELTDPNNARLLNQLGWQHDRGNLLRCLFEPGVEPTNNRAERALRPAVIARKVSQCSKNERGAAVRSAFTSVVRTLCQRRAGGFVAALAQVFDTGVVPAAPP